MTLSNDQWHKACADSQRRSRDRRELDAQRRPLTRSLHLVPPVLIALSVVAILLLLKVVF